MVERSLELSSEELLAANQELHRHGQELERRVAARTAELLEANRELEREIGERRRAEERGAAAEHRLRGFIEALPAVTYIAEFGPTGRWHYVSPQVEALLGVAPADLLAQPGTWYQRIHPEDRARVLAEEERASNMRSPFTLEYRIPRDPERVLWVRDQALPANDGAPILYQGVILDVSDRKALEAELLQAQKVEAIGRLAGGVAHDFNNILTAIYGYAELLERRVEADPEAAAEVAEIQRAARRAAELTAKLLAFGRRQLLRPRPLDLGELVIGVEPMLRRLIGEHVALERDLAGELGLVRADPAQLEQVLVNLAINARDAMPKGGTLRLRTENRPGRAAAAGDRLEAGARCTRSPHVALVVEDTGVGIDAGVLDQIFEPFFTTKPEGKGTGLGLATVHGIVRQSGGEIQVESQAGRGTRFEILLPRIAGASSPGPAATEVAAGSPRGRETILLVEDEPSVRKLAGDLLGELGYRVLTAGDGIEALALARETGLLAIDLLLTDVVMPRLGGLDLADRLRAERPDLRVLFASGYSDRSPFAADGLRTGKLDAFLLKPFTLARLAQRVREILDRGL